MKSPRRNRTERGNFILEFAIVAPLLVLLLAGSVDVGLALNRSILAGQVCRNANVLTVRGIDLSQSQNQQLLMRTAAGLGMTAAGSWTPSSTGNGVIFLTKVYRVGPLECSLGITNWDGNQGSCPNYGQYVIASRISIGNSSRWTSPLGTPATTPQSNGTLPDSAVASNTGNVAQGFPGIISLSLDQYTYVSEIYVDTSAYQLFSIVQAPIIYMRNLS